MSDSVMPGDVHSDAFYLNQYVTYPHPNVPAAEHSQDLARIPLVMPRCGPNLEIFRSDVYSCVELENTPIAEKITELLALWVKMRAEGRLYDATPPPTTLSSLSGSSQEPSPVDALRNDLDNAGGNTCKWKGCGRPLEVTPRGIKSHILECHHADVPVPVGEWETSNAKVTCRWSECKTVLYARSIPKHITGVHFTSSAVKCPIEGCDESLSRGDALKRHMKQKHAQK